MWFLAGFRPAKELLACHCRGQKPVSPEHEVDEHRVSVTLLQDCLDTLSVEFKDAVHQLNLCVALHRSLLIKQTQRIHVLLWLSDNAHQGENWAVIASPELLMCSVMHNLVRTRGVILNKHSVCVAGTLVFLIDELVSIGVAFVSRHECDSLLLIVWEDSFRLSQQV